MKKADRSEAEGIPTFDPAYAILAGVLEIAPATRWSFARIEPHGEIAVPFGSHADEIDLRDELRRQRAKSRSGPRIASMLVPLGEFAAGITLIFADARADFGLMTLVRNAELGPFTSSEISMLTFALDAGSDRLSALRLQPPASGEPSPAPPPTAPISDVSAFYVLDNDLRIRLAWSSDAERRADISGVAEAVADRLPAVLEETVRELTATWASDVQRKPGVARPVAFLVVRTQPMSGPAGAFIGVRIDRFQPPNSLTGAATRFHISPREIQVLALLLDGEHLDQISTQLHITSSTVQDHIKSMLEKTESRNRSELIARVLGWESTPNPR